MDTLINLAAMLEGHLDNAKQSFEQVRDVKENIASLGSLRSDVPLLRSSSNVAQDDDLHRKLDELLARDVVTSVDTAEIHRKLSELAASQGPPDVTIDLDGIEDIQQQISTSAADISAFLQFQTKLLSAQHENKEKETQEAVVELARYNAEKNSLELIISDLQDVKHGLKSDIASLHSEKEMLTAQKSRLAAEVLSLETALSIRREELEMMDIRADALERRIIDGVMDHSKALLMTKAARNPVTMSLKRVPSNASTATTVPSSAASAGVDIALKLPPALRRNPVKASPAERRILSLGQITSNVPRGGSALSVAPSRKAFASQMKRSQSVKQVTTRKSSWAGQGSLMEYDKENDSHTDDSDSGADTSGDIASSMDYASRPTTRTELSRTATSRTDQRSSYGAGDSEYTYDTGSYLTESEASNRTTSYGSTIRSTLGARSSLGDDNETRDGEHQDSASDYDEDHTEGEIHKTLSRETLDKPHAENLLKAGSAVDEELPPMENEAQDSANDHQTTDVVLHRPGYDSGLGPEMQAAVPEVLRLKTGDDMEKDMRREGYDSGLGSDLPTAALSSFNGSDYFKGTL